MKNKRVIWLLVLSMILGTAAPAGAYADTQSTETSLEACAEAVDDTQEPADTPTTAQASADTATTAPASDTAASTETEEETEARETESPGEEQEASTEHTADATESGENSTAAETSSESSTESSDQTVENGESKDSAGETEATVADSEVVDDQFADEITEEDIADSEYDSNEDLIAAQNIVVPDISELIYEFRYTQVEDPEEQFLIRGSKVYEEGNEDADVVGYTLTGSFVYVLANKEEDWVYIESGKVRGFVHKEDLTTENFDKYVRKQELSPYTYLDCISMGNPMYNEALTYTLTTAYDPVDEDAPQAVAAQEVSVYDRKNIYDEEAVAVGTLKEGDLCYILADENLPFVYVESGDVRGFVAAEALTTGDSATAIVEEKGAESMELAEQLVEPKDNPALHYTLTSVKKADPNSGMRMAIIQFAQQFVGNPYVWGGTSLLHGADCSGFCQQIYKYFGYSLPRTSRSQSKYGTQIPVSSALPGDLIFYAKDGVVYHVAMYIGDGLTVQARGKKWGIVVCGIGKNAVWATRILD